MVLVGISFSSFLRVLFLLCFPAYLHLIHNTSYMGSSSSLIIPGLFGIVTQKKLLINGSVFWRARRVEKLWFTLVDGREREVKILCAMFCLANVFMLFFGKSLCELLASFTFYTRPPKTLFFFYCWRCLAQIALYGKHSRGLWEEKEICFFIAQFNDYSLDDFA